MSTETRPTTKDTPRATKETPPGTSSVRPPSATWRPTPATLRLVYEGIERLGFPVFIAIVILGMVFYLVRAANEDARMAREDYRQDSKEERSLFRQSLKENTEKLDATAKATQEVALRSQQTNEQLRSIEQLLGRVLTKKTEAASDAGCGALATKTTRLDPPTHHR
jgi:hypothetical protein